MLFDLLPAPDFYRDYAVLKAPVSWIYIGFVTFIVQNELCLTNEVAGTCKGEL